LSNPKWLDKDGADTSKSLVGETLKLVVDCNDDMDDGAGVVFAIFDKDGNKVTELASVNDGGKAEVEWIYKYKHDAENPLSEKPKFTFKAKAKYCKEVESESVEIYSDLIITIIDSLSKTVGDLPLEITIGDSLEEVKTDTEGLFEKKDIAPGIAYVTVVMDTSYERPDSSDYTVSEDEKIIPVPAAIGKHTVSIEIGKKMVLRLTQNNQGLST
jgi:hypothetical protein